MFKSWIFSWYKWNGQTVMSSWWIGNLLDVINWSSHLHVGKCPFYERLLGIVSWILDLSEKSYGHLSKMSTNVRLCVSWVCWCYAQWPCETRHHHALHSVCIVLSLLKKSIRARMDYYSCGSLPSNTKRCPILIGNVSRERLRRYCNHIKWDSCSHFVEKFLM